MLDFLLSNKLLIALLIVVALVTVTHALAFGMARSAKREVKEASVWGKAIYGGRTRLKQQDAQLDELSRLVAHIDRPPNDDQSPPPLA